MVPEPTPIDEIETLFHGLTLAPEPTPINEIESFFQELTSSFIDKGMPKKLGLEQMSWLVEKSRTYKEKEVGLCADFYMKVTLLKLDFDYDDETKQRINASLEQTLKKMNELVD